MESTEDSTRSGSGKELAVAGRDTTLERVPGFSGGVFAMLITILVLELKPPSAHGFTALLPCGPPG
jgi:uncharacterized membrane protein